MRQEKNAKGVFLCCVWPQGADPRWCTDTAHPTVLHVQAVTIRLIGGKSSPKSGAGAGG